MIINYALSLFVVVWLFTVIDITNLNKRIKQNLFGLLCSLSVFAIFVISIFDEHYLIGDHIQYIEIYNIIPPITEWFDGVEFLQYIPTETGYTFFNALIKGLFDNYEIVFWVIGLLTLSLYYNSFRKYTPWPFTAFFIYFSNSFIWHELVFIRHGLATAICFFSIRYIYKKQLVPFLLCCFLACSFHLVAVIFLPVYFLNKIEWNNKKLIGICIISLLLIFVNWVSGVATFLDYERVLFYTNNDVGNASSVLFSQIREVFLLLIVWIFRNRLNMKKDVLNSLLTIFVWEIFTRSLFHEMTILLRFSMLLISSQFILQPALLSVSNKPLIRIFILFAIWGLNFRFFIVGFDLLFHCFGLSE